MSDGLLRHSSVMAVGTILSRLTGLIRTSVLAAALGLGLLADAFNVANTLPNIVYELLLGGVLTAVLVPTLVRAGRDDQAAGDDFARRLLSAVVVVLGLATVVLVVLAPLLMRAFLSDASDDQLRVATAFARFFLPQMFFYGVGATISAILNARGHFAAPMWAPILNNLVVIATLVAFIFTTGTPDESSITDGQIALLGIGTTAGIVLQTVALLPALRAVGFRLGLTTQWRGAGLGAAMRLGAWTLVYVAANQVAYWVVVRLGSSLSKDSAGYSVYTYAYLIFSLPHAIVAVSVISALLPQMSRHAADGDTNSVARDLARGTRLASVVLVPAALFFLVLHGPVAELLFGYGQSRADAPAIGWVLAWFAIGLVPFSAFQLQLRAFYAMADTKTPALINIAVNAANIAADVVLFAVLPEEQRIYGLAAGYALSYLVGWIVATNVLRRRLGGLGTATTVRTLVRLTVAGTCGALGAAGLHALIRPTLGSGTAGSLTSVVLGALVAAAVTLALAKRMRVPEATELVSVVRRRG